MRRLATAALFAAAVFSFAPQATAAVAATPPMTPAPWHIGPAGVNVPATVQGVHVPVAIIDTGAECDLPFFAGRVRAGASFVDTNPCHDGVGHGTATAGDLLSVAPMAVVREYKIFPDTSESTDDNTIAQAIVQAVKDHNALISLSLGGPDANPNTLAAVNYAAANNVLVFAASGNDGCVGCDEYPASYSTVLRIAATDANRRRVWFSNAASNVALACPGADVYSAFPVYPTLISQAYAAMGDQSAGSMRQWASLSGTSMATPACAGAAVRLLALGVRPADAVAALAATAHRYEPRDDVGAGIPDVSAAIRYARLHGLVGQWTPPAQLTQPTAPSLDVGVPLSPYIVWKNGRLL